MPGAYPGAFAAVNRRERSRSLLVRRNLLPRSSETLSAAVGVLVNAS